MNVVVYIGVRYILHTRKLNMACVVHIYLSLLFMLEQKQKNILEVINIMYSREREREKEYLLYSKMHKTLYQFYLLIT